MDIWRPTTWRPNRALGAALAIALLLPGAADAAMARTSRDADQDGVPNRRDQCPGTLAKWKAQVDTRGCPDPLVVVTERALEHRAKIYFAVGKAELE